MTWRPMTPEERQAVREDVHAINLAFLDVLTDSANAPWVRQRWALNERALSLLHKAPPAVRACIARCDAPLVRLRLPRRPVRGNDAVPMPIARLQFRTLVSALKVGMLDETVAAALYRAPREAFERLKAWPVEDVQTAAHYVPAMVTPRQPGAPGYWQKLVDGGRVGGPVGAHLLHNLVMMGTE